MSVTINCIQLENKYTIKCKLTIFPTVAYRRLCRAEKSVAYHEEPKLFLKKRHHIPDHKNSSEEWAGPG